MRHSVWTLSETLTAIREIQPAVMQLGFYLALGGGVLNKGFSANDLDLLLVPRTEKAVVTEPLISLLQSKFGQVTDFNRPERVPVGLQYKFANRTEIVLVQTLSSTLNFYERSTS